MTNPNQARRIVLRATQTVTIEGKDYRLTFDMNAMSDLEQVTGENAFDLIDRIMQGETNATNLRALMWAQLQEHHPDTDLRAAGRLISADLEACTKALQAALLAAMPPAPAQDDAGNAPGPATTPSAA